MVDPKELALKARNTLSQALEALQTGDNVPEKLLDIAAPIAKTMGVLHRVEKQGTGSAQEIDAALEAVRGVLDSLQEVGQDHPSVDAAMEAVASSLSKMFALSKALKAAEAAGSAAPRPQTRVEAKPEAKPEARPVAKAEEAPKSARKAAQPAQTISATERSEPSFGIAVSSAVSAPEPKPSAHLKAEPVEAAPKSTRRSGKTSDVAAVPVALSKEKEAVAGSAGAPVLADGTKRIDVELGAHSGSNFYKGLSGNDVIEHGGLFVATYQIPKVGQAIGLRVHLPGDLEFEADGVVQWTRDTRSGESEPGFGTRVTRISPEGRQLVYRYVRNREPIFYDDL